MNRRTFVTSLAALLASSGQRFARDYAEDIVRELRRGGYRIVSVTRTFLGRVRIRAAKNRGEREIILNPATGEILRDLWVAGGFDAAVLERCNRWRGGEKDDRGDDDDDGGDDDRDHRDDDNDDNGSDNSGNGKGGGGEDDD